MVTTVYLVRHCEAMGNISEVFQGQTDGDISEKGARQLLCLKERFKDIELDVIYTSPLKRAFLTAGAVNGYHNLPLNIEKDIMEINGGDLEGKDWKELGVLFPEIGVNWKKDFAKVVSPNGESVADVYNRVKKAMLEIISDNKGKSIAVVSHGCAIYTFLAYIKGYKVDEISNLNLWVDNTSITTIKFNDEKGSIIGFNDCDHVNSSPSTEVHQMFWRDLPKTPII